MSGSRLGEVFRITTFGESHGPYIGVVIEGLQPGLEIDTDFIQRELDRRRPGQSKLVTPRNEADRAQIISGVFEGKTTGTPLCILIPNQDQRSRDYRQLADILRPGHASYTYLKKYGVFDYRGGGRASGRETATRVAAGAVAKQFLARRGIQVRGFTRAVANIWAEQVDFDFIEKNPVRCPDPTAADKMAEAIEQARKEGDSLGGIVEIVVNHVPPGLGEPVFEKLEAELARALMSIGAVKAFEMGSGFSAALLKGSEHNDPFWMNPNSGEIETRTNHAGGVLGGISNGMPLVMRIAVKPPSSIRKTQESINQQGEPVSFSIGGRHDPCICPRVVPVAEAMVALVLLDMILLQERLSQQKDLNRLRDAIDTIDTQLLLLLARRCHLTRQIGRLKEAEGRAVEDRDREQHLMEKWRTLGAQLNLPRELVTRVVEEILRASKKIQKDACSRADSIKTG